MSSSNTHPQSSFVPPLIGHIDHLVITCVNPTVTTDFYTRVLQMREEHFVDTAGRSRIAFHFGEMPAQKINVSELNKTRLEVAF